MLCRKANVVPARYDEDRPAGTAPGWKMSLSSKVGSGQSFNLEPADITEKKARIWKATNRRRGRGMAWRPRAMPRVSGLIL